MFTIDTVLCTSLCAGVQESQVKCCSFVVVSWLSLSVIDVNIVYKKLPLLDVEVKLYWFLFVAGFVLSITENVAN